MEWMGVTLSITTVVMIMNMMVNRLAGDIAHHKEQISRPFSMAFMHSKTYEPRNIEDR